MITLNNTEITEKVIQTIRETATVKVDQIDERADLRTNYGIDSLTFVEVVGLLEQEFNIQFDTAMLMYDNFSTVEKIVQIVLQKMND